MSLINLEEIFLIRSGGKTQSKNEEGERFQNLMAKAADIGLKWKIKKCTYVNSAADIPQLIGG